MCFFMLDIWKALFMIELLPGLRKYWSRHILSQSRQWEHILREYANFIASKGYIWSPDFSVSHLMCCVIKQKLFLSGFFFFLLWLLLFYLGQSFLISSVVPKTLFSKSLSQVSTEILKIFINLNGFLIRRLLITQ